MWAVPSRAGATPRPWLKTPFIEGLARVSPDGKWVSYYSDASGTNEVYVSSFDNPLDRVQVSEGNAWASAWRADGREIYYVTDDAVYAVEIRGTNPLDLGKPQLLFHVAGMDSMAFDVSPSGDAFYIARSTYGPLKQPMNLITNWKQLLDKR
jgi:Tol biopolymer transport system component